MRGCINKFLLDEDDWFGKDEDEEQEELDAMDEYWQSKLDEMRGK